MGETDGLEKHVVSTMTTTLDQAITDHLDRLCKPPGSLGDLESLARALCLTQQTLMPVTSPRRTVIFAADHGVTCEGVSAWSSEVTALVVEVMQKRRTASGVFAIQLQCEYEVVDIGLRRNVEPANEATCLLQEARRFGTDNLRIGAAMSESDFDHAWGVGQTRANAAVEVGCRLVIGGEMGIGNTTSASCLVSWLSGVTVEEAVGHGAGLDDAGLARKRTVVRDAIERVKCLGDVSAKQVGYELGGLEIVALAGFYARAAELRLTIVLDGFIATAAALLANAICPDTSRQMIAGHRSTEPGHMAALSSLGLAPVLNLNFRLGEATGALAALPLIDLAAAMMNGMATLSELAPE